MLLGAGSALARRLGEAALAVEWAARGARLRPSKLAEIWLGYAYRSAGRIPESLAALRRAVMHDPDDLSVYADIAGTLADHGRLDDALAWIDRALAKRPGVRLRRAHRAPAAVPRRRRPGPPGPAGRLPAATTPTTRTSTPTWPTAAATCPG